jgi:Sulfotransferase domain
MSLRLIGAGYGRTGTLSLKLALEQIGYGPCYHMTEVLLAPESTAPWIRAADGDPDWEAIFKGFASTVDFPGCTFWRQLSEFYPQAKVLLSVRDPEKWFESTQATIFSVQAIERFRATPMEAFMNKVAWNIFSLERIHDRDFMIATFKRHNAEVERSIPKDRLLVYDVSQGWEPLCKFLNVPVPETPFPRTNTREEMTAMMASHASGGPDAGFDMKRLQETLKGRLGRT